MTNNQFDEIVWPTTTTPVLKNKQDLQRNIEIIKFLCENGVVTEWHDEENGLHMPYSYHMSSNGDKIQFMLHWGGMYVNGKWDNKISQKRLAFDYGPKNFKMMKVFNCQNMPKDVQKLFFEESNKGNDCYVSWYVYDSVKFVEIVGECNWLTPDRLSPITEGEIIFDEVSEGVRKIIQRGDDPISDWLHDNGANHEEEILIKHSW